MQRVAAVHRLRVTGARVEPADDLQTGGGDQAHQFVRRTQAEVFGEIGQDEPALAAGDPLPHGTALDPAGMPRSLRALAVSGQRGTVVTELNGTPVMWAAGPADGRALATTVDYTQSARTISAAVGIVMANEQLTYDAGFDRLAQASQQANVKLRDIADHVLLTGALPAGRVS